MTTTQENPFIRGYQKPKIVRTMLITYEDDFPPAWRPLHDSQAHLADELICQSHCLFCPDFALITEGQVLPRELELQCPTEGFVRAVTYAIVEDDASGLPIHIGDTHSEKSAHDVVQRLTFETGFYSRCWEISFAHLTEQAERYLAELADTATPAGFLFVAFRIPYHPAIGVKLISTPWIDEHLLQIDNITAAQLRQEHLSKGMPEDLADVLALAGQADIRILIFDADAPALPGLSLNEP